MKSSAALLVAIRENGGKIEHHQMELWIGQLIKGGFLQIAYDNSSDITRVFFEITEQGRKAVERYQ